MIISVNWLKKFTDIDLSIDELTKLIGARIVEIEQVIDLGAKYKDALIVRVVECGPLEGTDHLNLTKIDDNGVRQDVERDENGLVQVVCGASNVRAGMLAVWLPPNSIVPDSYATTEPFTLMAKQLRGAISNGMLASAKELALFEDHMGILEIDKDVEAGTSFADTYDLNDYLLDIENKSLTHRPDTFGIIGFAREVAAVQGKAFVTPEWLAGLDPTYGDKSGDVMAPTVTIDDAELSARYQAVVLSDADSGRQSPLEIQTYLARVGVRPINAVVDVTNYLMMLTGQPLHAFDYDKLVSVGGGQADIHVRAGKADEKLELLDGRTINLTPDDIVIAAGDKAVGLAGAMGGLNTVIDENTKNIIIESATFNLFKLRSTQMRHGIFSEAITRFTKGQPAELTAPVLAEAVQLMGEWSDAKRVSGVAEAVGSLLANKPILITASRVNRILGTTLSQDQIVGILRSVEFAVVEDDADNMTVAAPYWRADIHIVEDVIEEIGRLLGFDSITPTLPSRNFAAILPSKFDSFRANLRRHLVRAGANEVLTYSFVHGDIMRKVGQKVENAYRITNSLSPDLQYYRQSLTPSLLGLIYPNIKQGYDKFAIFELNKIHQKSAGLTDENVPVEIDNIALSVASVKTQSSAAFYEAKRILTYLISGFGLNLKFESIIDGQMPDIAAPFEAKRSALVLTESDDLIGIIGEYKKDVSTAFKLPDYAAGFELDSRKLFMATSQLKPSYQPSSRYPGTERDICFQVPSDIEYASIVSAIQTALADSEFDTNLQPVDIYQAEGSQTKNITLRISLTAGDRTLTADEANQLVERVSQSVISLTGAVVI